MAKTPKASAPAAYTTNRKPDLRTLATAEELRQTEIKNRNLLLFDLFRANLERTGDPIVRGVKFENCQIEGPAVMLPLSGCHFNDCNFGASFGDLRNLVLFPAAPDKVTGGIAMLNCTFEGVDFFGIGFTGPKPFTDSLLAVQVVQEP